MAIDWTKLLTLLGTTAKNRAEGQQTQALIDNQNNNTATSRYQALVNANRLQNIEMPTANTDQAIQGTKLSTWQPVSVSHPRATISHISGGPQMTDELRQYGSDLTKSAILRQMGGNQLDTSTFPTDSSLGLNSTKSSGTLDNILGYGTTGLGILNALGLVGGSGAGAGAGAGASTAFPGSGTQMTSLTNPATTTTPTPTGTGNTLPIGGGGASTGPQGLQRMATIAQLMGLGLGPDPDPNAIATDRNSGDPNWQMNQRNRRSART